MNWSQRQRWRRFLGGSLWLIPVASMLAAILAARASRWLSTRVRWTMLDLGPEGARALTGVLGSSLLTFIVFVISSLLLAMQIASGQLSPLVTSRVFENRMTQLAIGAFVFAWVFSVSAGGRIEDRVPELAVDLAVLFSMISVGLFLALAQRVAYFLRPVTILTQLGNDTRAVIEVMYPEKLARQEFDRGYSLALPSASNQAVEHHGRAGVFVGFDAEGLVDIARRAQCSLEIVPAIGDFVVTGGELLRVHGESAVALDETTLGGSILLGPERTMEQDPEFGFRIIVDIAIKALSPAINDPTSAVLAIDQLHHLLQLLGQRQLDSGVWRDQAGEVRLVCRTPEWEDFVTLAVTEIRLYAGMSAQVTRRLQAMFDSLLLTLPEQRAAAVRKQVAMLRMTVERTIVAPQDCELAMRPDLQGLGSAQHVTDGSSECGGKRPEAFDLQTRSAPL